MRLVHAALLLLLPVAVNAASSAAALYNRGNQLYQAGEYHKARQTYLKALDTGVESPELFYNLGNAQLRSGRLGPAIASYLRARRMSPRDPDLLFNLEYARERIKARLPELEQGPVSRAFNAAVCYLSVNEWTAIGLGAYWLIALAAIGMILARTGPSRRAFRLLIYLGVLALVLVMPFASVRIKRDLVTPRGVILADKVAARSGPGPDNASLFDLYEGMDVEVAQCESGWCRVSAPGGFIGWVQADSFERI